MNDDVIGAPAGAVDFDRPAMARLTRMALRGRSISEATEETGLSRSMISKLLNQNLKNPPTVNTLRKLNIGNPPELFRQMLIACGYPLDIQDEINAFLRIVEEMPAFADVRSDRLAWNSSHALAMVPAEKAMLSEKDKNHPLLKDVSVLFDYSVDYYI